MILRSPGADRAIADIAVGDHEEDVSGIEDIVSEYFLPFSSEELLAAPDAATDIGELSQTVVRIGLGAPNGFDPAFFERIAAMLENGNPALRDAAVWSAVLTGWAEFELLLSRIAEDDSDPSVRNDARAVLDIGLSGTGER